MHSVQPKCLVLRLIVLHVAYRHISSLMRRCQEVGLSLGMQGSPWGKDIITGHIYTVAIECINCYNWQTRCRSERRTHVDRFIPLRMNA